MKNSHVLLVACLGFYSISAFSASDYKSNPEYKEAYKCGMDALKGGSLTVPYCIGNSRDPSKIEMQGFEDAEKDFSKNKKSSPQSTEPNVKIEVYNKTKQITSYYSEPYVQVKVKAIADTVIVKSVVINRGNCEIFNKRVLNGNFVEMFPATLKFGESATITSKGKCEAVQVDVVTDNGSWTVEF